MREGVPFYPLNTGSHFRGKAWSSQTNIIALNIKLPFSVIYYDASHKEDYDD